MDELKPTKTRRRLSHHRRLRLTGILTGAFLLLFTILTQTTAEPSSETAPNILEQAIDTTKQAVEDSLGPAKETVLDAQPGLWHVTRAIDGDTIEVVQGSQKESVRLLGIDTPETHDPRKPVQCFGEAAATHTRQLLENKNVRLEPDPTNSDRDKYKRLLRYVYLSDGTLVNAQLIQDGYAFAYVVFPLVKLEDFRALERQAREANRGLWADCNVDESTKVKQTSSGK